MYNADCHLDHTATNTEKPLYVVGGFFIYEARLMPSLQKISSKKFSYPKKSMWGYELAKYLFLVYYLNR